MSEQIERPRPQITTEPVTENDLKELMMGTNGNPSYAEQWGLSTAAPGELPFGQKSMAELELEAAKAHARALDPTSFGGQVPQGMSDEELSKYKKLYGDSENEKGELRKQLNELNEAFSLVTSQLEAMGQQQVAPQPQYGQAPYGQPYAQQPPQPYGQIPYGPTYDLDSLDDETPVYGKQVKEIVRNAVGPVVLSAFQEAQAARQATEQLRRQAAAQAKAAAGITAVDEWRMAAQNPWLRNLPEAQRWQAMATLKRNSASTPNGQLSQAPATAVTDTQQRIVNKTTYIEGGQPQTPESSQAALDAAYARDIAFARSLNDETGERARALRMVAKKYGLPWGTASDLAR